MVYGLFLLDELNELMADIDESFFDDDFEKDFVRFVQHDHQVHACHAY